MTCNLYKIKFAGGSSAGFAPQIPAFVEKFSRLRFSTKCNIGTEKVFGELEVCDDTDKVVAKLIFTPHKSVFTGSSCWVQVGELTDEYVAQIQCTASESTWSITRIFLYLPKITDIDQIKNI